MADEQHDKAAGDLPARLAGPARRALAASGRTFADAERERHGPLKPPA